MNAMGDDTANVRVELAPEARRYEIHVDDRPAGYVGYHRYGDEIAFLHTEVSGDFEGMGLGSKLARHVLDDAAEHDMQVLPYCPFISGWIGKHPEYTALVPEDRREKFQL